MKRHIFVRVVAIVIVAVLVLGLFSGALAMFAFAANEPQPKVVTGGVTLVGASSMVLGKAGSKSFTVNFSFRLSEAGSVTLEKSAGGSGSLPGHNTGDKLTPAFSLPGDTPFTFEKDSVFTISHSSINGIYDGSLTLINYNGDDSRILSIEVDAKYNTTPYTLVFDVPIGTKYIRGPSTSTPDDEEKELITSDIVVESVTVKDSAGKVLTDVTKDTAPFTVEIVYSDLGLAEVGRFRLEEATIDAFITNASGFKIPGGTKGTATLISGAPIYPRFRAVFKNVQTDASADSMSFRIQYAINDYEGSVKGEGTAVLYQITKPEDEKDTAPLRPNLIIEQYSYGTQTIVAGSEFDLSMTVANTSRETGVENVVMTIEPASGFVITAASNTMFFQSMGAGSHMPYTVPLRTMPSSDDKTAVTDYSVTVKFAYQYLSNKEYTTGETSVKIAIPVSQLDRFEIDTITEYSQYLMTGEEGYVTVPITNKGKSPTYNISGVVRSLGGGEVIAPATYYGNLEAGKADTVDLSFNVSVSGEFHGEAVITYEDENMNPKELVMPFVSMINEPGPPPGMEQPGGMEPPPPAGPEGPGVFTIVMCTAGGLFMAVPTALYMIKRAKAKGDEDIDEDF